MWSVRHENDLSNHEQHFDGEEETTKGPWPSSLQESGTAAVVTAAAPKRKRMRNSRGRGPKFVFKIRSEKDVMEDGYRWRKYGKKAVKSSPFPRNYYKCLNSSCTVRKRIERDPMDESIVVTTYEGTHNHERPCVVYYYVTKP